MDWCDAMSNWQLIKDGFWFMAGFCCAVLLGLFMRPPGDGGPPAAGT